MKTSSHNLIDYIRSLVHRRYDVADGDRELLHRFVAWRDDDAFAALMRRHGPMVLNLARRITGDEQLAEDVFQATFLLLSQKAHTIRRPEALPCWLHGSAHRLAVQARRSQLRHPQREAWVQPPSPPNPLEELTAQEFLTVLDEELRRLPENQRAPLILCCLEGLSQEEAAKRLGCSSDAIKGRLERGRNRLRLRLEKRGLTLPAVLGATLLTAGAVKALPPLLLQSTLHAGTTGIGATPAVAALIQETMRMMFLHKLKWVGAAVLLFVLGGAGVGTMALRPQAAKESAPPVAAADDKPLSPPKRVDLYGDPLPEGAVMRLGTIQRRAVGAQLGVSTDGESIVSVRGGRYVCIWDATTGQIRQRSELPVDSFLFMGLTELSPNGRWLAEQRPGSDTSLTIWEVRTGKKMCDLILKDTGKLHSCAFSTDGRRIASVGSLGKDSLVRIWNVSDGKRIFDQRILANSCESLIFTPDGKYLLARVDSWRGDLYCWDIECGRQLWRSKKFEPYPLILTPDGNILSWQQHESPALDLATGQSRRLRLPSKVENCSHLLFSPDGRTLLLSCLGDVIVWDYRKSEQRQVLKRAGEPAVFTPDGKHVVTNNGSLQCWDLATGNTVWPDTFAWGHVDEVTALVFSADGRHLLSGSPDGSVRLWEAETGRPLRVWNEYRRPAGLPGAPSGVSALALTPNGSQLLCAGLGGILQLHDTNSGKLLHKLLLSSDDFLEGPPYAYELRISRDGS